MTLDELTVGDRVFYQLQSHTTQDRKDTRLYLEAEVISVGKRVRIKTFCTQSQRNAKAEHLVAAPPAGALVR